MSEKRFELIEDDLEPLILDNKETMSVNEVVDCLNEQQARIEMLEKGILDCLFNNKSIGMLAEEMGLVE